MAGIIGSITSYGIYWFFATGSGVLTKAGCDFFEFFI